MASTMNVWVWLPQSYPSIELSGPRFVLRGGGKKSTTISEPVRTVGSFGMLSLRKAVVNVPIAAAGAINRHTVPSDTGGCRRNDFTHYKCPAGDTFGEICLEIYPPAGGNLRLALHAPGSGIPGIAVAPCLRNETSGEAYSAVLGALHGVTEDNAPPEVADEPGSLAAWLLWSHGEVLVRSDGLSAEKALAACWEVWGAEAASGASTSRTALAWALLARADAGNSGGSATSSCREAVWAAAVALSHRAADAAEMLKRELGEASHEVHGLLTRMLGWDAAPPAAPSFRYMHLMPLLRLLQPPGGAHQRAGSHIGDVSHDLLPPLMRRSRLCCRSSAVPAPAIDHSTSSGCLWR